MSWLFPLLSLMGTASNVDTATDPSATAPDRVAAGVGGVGTVLSTLGAGTSTTALGAMTGTTALTASSAAAAGGAVLGAGAGGYAFGTAMDRIVGRALGGEEVRAGRGVNGGTTREADTRRASERWSDEVHTEGGDSLARTIAPYLPVWLGGG